MASRTRTPARIWIPVGLVVLLFVLLYIGLTLNPRHESDDSPLIGQIAPDFSLPDLLQPNQSFSQDDLKGQISLVNVWATWCPSCRAEHDVLMKLAKTAETESFKIYGIDWKDNRAEALEWLNALGNPYDKSGFDGDNIAGLEWGVTGAPETFVIDTDGRICERYTGPLDTQNVNSHFLPMIREIKENDGKCV